jgi:1,3-beta-glucanosyltransferase GAS5
VNYYPRPNTGNLTQTNSVDYFTEEFRSVWTRDIEFFKQLNVNVVGLYAVEPGKDHNGFMCALQAANIYVIVGLSADCENCAIDKATLPPTCYSPELKRRGQFIISEFKRFDNVLAFSAGNEVSLNSVSELSNAPCQKQFIRDMRAFIASCNSTIRPIPVGLAFADNLRDNNSLYYGCRSNTSDTLENAEYIGINAYQHCNGNSDVLLGYEKLLSDFSNYSLPMPAIISEFGCLDGSFPTIDGYAAQRNFLDVDALFTQRYRNQFAGGLVFEYSTELLNAATAFPFTTFGTGSYGIGYLTPENCNDQSIPCEYQPFPQFKTLATKYAAVDTSDEPSIDDYVITDTTFPQCPSQIPALSTITWPTASTDDLACPEFVYVKCPNVPAECSNLGIASILTPLPVSPATPNPTKSPSASKEEPSLPPNEIKAPTAPTKPSARPVSSPTVIKAPSPTSTGGPNATIPISSSTSSSRKSYDFGSDATVMTVLLTVVYSYCTTL